MNEERKFKEGDLVFHKTNDLQKLLVIKYKENPHFEGPLEVVVKWFTPGMPHSIHEQAFLELELEFANPISTED